MAAVTTHDLPTVAGAFGGAPGDLQLDLLRPMVGDRDPAVALYEQVGSSPALLASAALDDVLGATVQPNVPGTVDEFPNWRVPLPAPLESIPDDPHAQAVLEAVSAGRQEPGAARRTPS
jgi:4-alpha-glucanotransferase